MIPSNQAAEFLNGLVHHLLHLLFIADIDFTSNALPRDAATFSAASRLISATNTLQPSIQPLGQASQPLGPPVMAVWPLVFDTFMFLLVILTFSCPALKMYIWLFLFSAFSIEFSLYYIIYVGMCPHIFFFMLECVDFSVGL